METVESVMEVANCEFLHGFSASFRRVTPSTHVGRLSDPHFELGFSVILSCHDGKEGEGTERCRSPQNSIVLKKFSKGLEKDLYRLANSRAVG